MTTLNTDFNQFAFTNYLRTIGGNLYKTNFYTELFRKRGMDKSVLDRMLGVSNPVDGDPTIIDPELLYANWEDKNNYVEYALEIQNFLGSDTPNIDQPYAELQLMSAFLIQYYFFVKRNVNSVLPRLVGPNETGYYVQTTNLYLFFRDNRARGIGNLTISSMCEQNYSFVDGDESKRIYISRNSSLLNWCGCFAPQDPINEAAGFEVPNECDPLCVTQSSIKLWDRDARIISCNSAVCVISGISLNIEDSADRIYNINQICSACEKNSTEDQPCRCVIDSDFASLLTKISAPGVDGKPSGMDVSSTFNRYCPNAICVITDYTQAGTTVVPCNTLNPAATGLGDENYATGEVNYTFDVGINSGTISLIVLFILIPLVFLCFIAIVKNTQEIVVKNKRPPPGGGSQNRIGIN